MEQIEIKNPSEFNGIKKENENEKENEKDNKKDKDIEIDKDKDKEKDKYININKKENKDISIFKEINIEKEIKIEENKYQQNEEDEIIPIDNIDRTRYNESLNIDKDFIKENYNNNNAINDVNINNNNDIINNNNNLINEIKFQNDENNLDSSKCFHDLPLQLKSNNEIKKRKSSVSTASFEKEKLIYENVTISLMNKYKFLKNTNSSEPFLFIEGGLSSVR
jgi:hypothetical protein